MSSYRFPSVNNTFFQHKQLTKVNGKPVYTNLQILFNKVKANAGSVPSTLGGSQYGHLGLILSDECYTSLSNSVPWVTPNYPGPFDPPENVTRPHVEAAKDVWTELTKTFDLAQATEKALIAQIIEAIDPEYLRPLLNRTTGQHSNDIREVFEHLFSIHGKITPQQVKANKMSISNMTYDISQPVDTVFSAVNDHAELAEHARRSITTQQMIDLAYVIFSKEPTLTPALRTWNEKPPPDKTCALDSLPTATDVYHQQPAHQANTLADLVAQRLLKKFPPQDDVANAAIQSPELTALQAQVQAMQQMMLQMQIGTSPIGTSTPRTDNT